MERAFFINSAALFFLNLKADSVKRIIINADSVFQAAVTAFPHRIQTTVCKVVKVQTDYLITIYCIFITVCPKDSIQPVLQLIHILSGAAVFILYPIHFCIHIIFTNPFQIWLGEKQLHNQGKR